MINKQSSLRSLISMAALAVSLTGCASLVLAGSGETPPRYTLAPVTFEESVVEALPVRLIIADPNAEAAFATSRIAHSPAKLRYDYFEEGEWSDRAPRLFGIFLERSFENSGQILAVGDRISVPVGDYILQTDIRGFHIETRKRKKVARLEYYVRLTDGRNNTIASKLFSASEQVPTRSVGDAVTAFNAAANVAGEETIAWALANIKAQ